MGAVQVQVLFDGIQRGADGFGAEDEDEARTVPPVEDAGAVDAAGLQQALGFIEADGAGGDAEFFRDFGDAEKIVVGVFAVTVYEFLDAGHLQNTGEAHGDGDVSIHLQFAAHEGGSAGEVSGDHGFEVGEADFDGAVGWGG